MNDLAQDEAQLGRSALLADPPPLRTELDCQIVFRNRCKHDPEYKCRMEHYASKGRRIAALWYPPNGSDHPLSGAKPQ